MIVVVFVILGIIVVMEEENVNNLEFDESLISVVKIVFMGFFVGIGDLLFWGIFRIIVVGVGVLFVKEGNIFGLLLFLLLYNILVFVFRIFGFKYGY